MDIKIQNLKKIYNGNTVLDIDNLGVAKGELIGLVGNNGAGKTTLLRLILDLIQADDGFVESNGQKVNEFERLQKGNLLRTTQERQQSVSNCRACTALWRRLNKLRRIIRMLINLSALLRFITPR